MIILGLNESNSAAAIIKNGELIAAAREERFSRIKFDDSFPLNAVDYCLKEAGVESIKAVDQIVFAWNPGHELEPHDSSNAVRYHKDFLHYVPNNLISLINGDKKYKRISSISQDISFFDGKHLNVNFVSHHRSHAASVFLVSPFEESAILTIDGYGDDIATQFFYGEGNKIKEISTTLFPHSMGHAYAAITQYLGFRPNMDEWKVMGLSVYGDENRYYKQFTELINFDDRMGELRLDLDFFSFYLWSSRRYSDQFVSLFGKERYHYEEIDEHHKDIAASFQKRIENVALDMCNYLYNKTKSKNLCLSGGVAMNSKMNGRILEESGFESLWIQPNSDDAGCCIGACFHYWNEVLDNKRTFRMNNDYWGPSYSEDDIEKSLKDSLLEYRKYEDIEKITAKFIANGDIIGWFQGRMEMGQRALGNRSILADPRDPLMKDKINSAIKHRELFRPFAPSILKEYREEYFENSHENPFMQIVFKIKPDKRDIIPAVTHYDGTGRSQTVSEDTNPRYFRLINEFRKITGIPILLNTSFNDNDEPIVCTPKDAIRCFSGTGIDHLVMGNFIVSKKRFF